MILPSLLKLLCNFCARRRLCSHDY